MPDTSSTTDGWVGNPKFDVRQYARLRDHGADARTVLDLIIGEGWPIFVACNALHDLFHHSDSAVGKLLLDYFEVPREMKRQPERVYRFVRGKGVEQFDAMDILVRACKVPKSRAKEIWSRIEFDKSLGETQQIIAEGLDATDELNANQD